MKKTGRPPHKPTSRDRKIVEALAGFGIPAAKIADVLGLGQSTVYRHYAGEMHRGRAMVESQLVGNLHRLAQGSDGTALKAIMFSLQTRFGWSQYLPRPADEKPLGKKAQADLDALEPPDDGWDELLQ